MRFHNRKDNKIFLWIGLASENFQELVASISTIWFVLRGEDIPRFVTAFPGEKA